MNTGAATTGEINGIRVLHVDRPGNTRATLHVGVGWADESFATRGITHVVEHLVMHGTTRGAFEANASVTAYTTQFWATGRPERVGRFLTEVTAAIRDLPLDHLAHETAVLTAELAGETGYGPHEAILKARFGHTGPGLAMFWGSGPSATDPEAVVAHLRRWFVRGNAVLTVAGPMPDGLDLALPGGDAPVRTITQTGTPGVVEYDVAEPVLSFVVPDGPLATSLAQAMTSRLEDVLRHRDGQVYAVMPLVLRLPGTGTILVQLGAQGAPGSATAVAEALAAEFAHRSVVGLTETDVADLLEWWDAAEHDSDAAADLDNDAERMLSGLPPLTVAEARAAIAALRPDAVAAAVREATTGALLLVPRDVTPHTDLPQGRACVLGREMTTRPLRRTLRSRAPRTAALGFDGDVVEFRDVDGDVHTVRFDEVVGVGIDGRSRELIGARGCFVSVEPRDFAGADAIVRAIDERLPAGLRFHFPTWLAGA